MAEQPPVQTHIRKIRIGTPVKRVVGAGIQRLGDLVVLFGEVVEHHLAVNVLAEVVENQRPKQSRIGVVDTVEERRVDGLKVTERT